MKATEKAVWPPARHRWTVRLMGRLEVVSSSNEVVRFRSRTALSLLAFLALSKDKEHPNDRLQELFWSDCLGDRQAQNLRRAIADLRSVLEEDLQLGSVVVTRRSHVSLNSDLIITDVERFLDLTSGRAESNEQDSLAEAVSLYSGALLAPLSDEWVMSRRMELEERFSQAVEQLCGMLVRQGKTKEAIRIGRAAVVAAPLREEVHIALISAYRHAGFESEAMRQFEEIERLLDETWGEVPSDAAKHALEDPLPALADFHGNSGDVLGPLEPEPSGGAMPLASRFYVRRVADVESESCLDRGEGVVLIQGPRQVGKSSLLARSLAHARSSGFAVILTDLQAMGGSQVLEEELLYRTLGQSLADQLSPDLDIGAEWRQWLGSNMNLDAILGKLLRGCERPVCWAFDEADLLFDRSYTNDLFGLLRSWHNRRALEPDGPWGKLTMVLAYATEAHLFITDLNQSPFNVGVRLSLHDLTEAEVMSLQDRHVGIASVDAANVVMDIAGGHPYLVQCAFAFLARGGSVDELRVTAARLDGPFGPHLKRVLVSVAQNEETLEEVKHFLRGEAFTHPMTRHRLQSAGLITISTEGKARFRVPIYESFLRGEIG